MNKTKKIIFEAAIKSFSKKGFYKSTMDEIAETAGVAKGTLYYHFNSKDDIFRFIINDGIGLIENEIKDRTKGIDSPIDKLITVCEIQFQLAIKHQEFFKTILSQMWGDEERQFELRNALKRYFDLLESFIKEAMDGGYIEKGNVEVLAYNFFGVISSAVVFNMLNQSVDKREIANTLVDFIIKGMGRLD